MNRAHLFIQLLGLGLALSCTKPDTNQIGQASKEQHAVKSSSNLVPFEWGLKKAELSSQLETPNNFNNVWNSVDIKRNFCGIDDSIFHLFFDFDDNTLKNIDIKIYNGNSYKQALNSTMKVFNCIKSFDSNFKPTFDFLTPEIIQSQPSKFIVLFSKERNTKIVLIPISTQPKNFKINVLLDLSESNKYSVTFKLAPA